ncbi:topoisomerase C-terminal repeat-containing protein [Neisseria leonii]|uniref:topoisomerase C-terminal repeat-containing protein n=1 Tax=Neisseria leonii TaxID=2995413 RepID=UPI003460A5C6
MQSSIVVRCSSCEFKVLTKIAGVVLKPNDIMDLLKGRAIRPPVTELTSKAGKVFKTRRKLNIRSEKIDFIFET